MGLKLIVLYLRAGWLELDGTVPDAGGPEVNGTVPDSGGPEVDGTVPEGWWA